MVHTPRYHAACLAPQGRDRVAEDSVAFETNHGQLNEDRDDDDFPLEHKEDSSDDGHPSKKAKTNGSREKDEPSSKPITGYSPVIVATLPPALLRIARRPITRGTPTCGIVGNCQFVLAARRIMRDVCEHEGILPEDWKVQCGYPAVDGQEGGLKLKTHDVLEKERTLREEEREQALREEGEKSEGEKSEGEENGRPLKRKSEEDVAAEEDEEGQLGGPDGGFVLSCPKCEQLI